MISTHFLYLEFKLWYLSISNSSEIPILYHYKSFQPLQKCRNMSEGCHIKRYDIVKGCKILGINTNINNHGKKKLKRNMSRFDFDSCSRHINIILDMIHILLSTSMTFNVSRVHQILLFYMLYAFY